MRHGRLTITETIDGEKFQIKLLGAETADYITFLITRAVGAFVAPMAGIGAAKFDPTSLPPKDFQFVIEQFRDECKVEIVDTEGDGRARLVALKTVYSEHFAGPEGRKLWGKWLAWAWEVNFGNFFDVVVNLVQGREKLVSSVLQKGSGPASSGDSSSPQG